MARDDADNAFNPVELSAIEFESPGRFRLENPSALPASPEQWNTAPLTQGGAPTVQAFSGMSEARQHTLAMIEQARRSLSIYTQDLEPWLYNHSCIQQACLRLLLGHPRNRLRILVGDSSRAIRQGHRMVNLARRLTSNLHIRKVNPDYPARVAAFLVADECGVVIRPEPDQLVGHALYQSPGRARQQQRLFDTAWDHSLSDPDLRSFLL